jgi:glycogen synthase
MKVLFASTNFPRWRGDGRGIALFQAAKALKAAGITVRVLAVHAPGSKIFEKMDRIEVYRPCYMPFENPTKWRWITCFMEQQ